MDASKPLPQNGAATGRTDSDWAGTAAHGELPPTVVPYRAARTATGQALRPMASSPPTAEPYRAARTASGQAPRPMASRPATAVPRRAVQTASVQAPGAHNPAARRHPRGEI